MSYVFDTNSFRELERFYPNVFKSVWVKLDRLVEKGKILSTREVWNEMERRDFPQHLREWLESKGRDKIFTTPTPEELLFVRDILSIKQFQSVIENKKLLMGIPVADPFVVACAKTRKGTVVTEEKYKPQSSKVPNICEHFGIPCISVEGFMREQKWEF